MPRDAATVERAAARRDDVLTKITESISVRGYPPSVRELAQLTDVSTLTTRRDLAALAAQGKIEVDAGVDRGIRLLVT